MTKKLKIMHYYSRLRWYEHIPFDDFRWSENRAIQETMKLS